MKRFAVISAVALMLPLTGCFSVSENINVDSIVNDTSSTSEYIESEPSTESISDISIPEISLVSIPDVSLPEINISVPDVSVPSFSFSSESSSSLEEDSSITENTSSAETSSYESTSSLIENTSDTKTIGNSQMGYIDIPADFVIFEDVEENTDLQYSDKTGGTIFTLNIVGDGSMSVDEIDLDQSAQLLAKFLTDKGAENLTGAKVKVAGKYDALQIYGYWSAEDKYLVVDLFKTDKNAIYLGVEFPTSNSQIVKYLDTYRESN